MLMLLPGPVGLYALPVCLLEEVCLYLSLLYNYFMKISFL